MSTSKSNQIPIIHRLVTDVHGENYWFNGCAGYVMECLGEKDYDYWFFAGLTGDIFMQHYTYDKYTGDAISIYQLDHLKGGDPVAYTRQIFSKCGYEASYIPHEELLTQTEHYKNKLMESIDKGVPVITWGKHFGVYVGYEEDGDTLLYITHEDDEPERIPFAHILEGASTSYWPQESYGGWIFVGEKFASRPLADLYREAILELPHHMRVKTDLYCFGPEAFRAWANDIARGKFDTITSEEFDSINQWAYYTNYVCVLATNGSCCHEFLKRARELNPDLDYLEKISALYRKMAQMWGCDAGENDIDSLEALGGGFNVTLETLQNPKKRDKIAAKIHKFADVAEEVLHILETNSAK